MATTCKIKTGDTVKILTGKDRGVQGEVLSVDHKKGRVAVRGVNVVRKALRPTRINPNGGIESREATIDASNVMVVCPECGIATRLGVTREDGKKKRVCKKCGKQID